MKSLDGLAESINETASPSMRREWIEIQKLVTISGRLLSPSMRREWIEMQCVQVFVAAREKSPSMRREWIEMFRSTFPEMPYTVSLHAEGVD